MQMCLHNGINAAFESLSFYQNRSLTSYSGDAPIITNINGTDTVTGTLIGTSFELQTDDFAEISIDPNPCQRSTR